MEWRKSEILFNEYEVSENAELRNAKTKNIVKPHLNKRHGRFYVTISYKGKIYCKKRSRIVAQAFVPNPKNYSDVNHINGIKTDDRSCNLEWLSRGDNIRHAITNGIRKAGVPKNIILDKKYRGNKNRKAVVQKDLNGKTIAEYLSVTHASDMTGFNYGNISSNCHGRKSFKTIGGFIFSFK